MKRTTSMKEFSFDDLSIIHNHHQPQPSDQLPPVVDRDRNRDNRNQNYQRMMSMVSPSPIHRRNSADFVLQSGSSSGFLATCSLCNRRLAPGRDIYMYRGDSAFCSLECRQQQMAQDEWREKEKNKCSASSSSPSISLVKESNPSSHSHSHSSPAGSQVSSANTEAVAAL